ncbi:hypothetical protein OG900_09345 [Streptomyces sp. NBC_00433]
MSTAAPSVGALPTMAEVARFADEQIITAAQALWPGAALEFGAGVPSVTGYVRRMLVGEQVVYAKVSLLGMSLVSLLRGAAGTRAHIQAAQYAYARTPGSPLEREAAQLAVLHRGRRPQVAPVLDYRRGVLFTQAVPGLSLADMLLNSPQASGPLMACVLERLDGLRRKSTSRLVIGAPIDRGVHATFQRKFAGVSAPEYLASLHADHPAATAVLKAVVSRLGTGDSAAVGLGRALTTVVYGDLTPEHVLYPGRPGTEPVFLSPALTRDTPLADPAQLLSRCVLVLLAAQPGRTVAEQAAQGFADFAQQQADRFPGLRDQALRNLLRLWAMDTANIMSTYLTTPADLPLPEHAGVLRTKAAAVLGIMHQLAGAFSARLIPEPVLRHALAAVVEAAS